MELGLKYAEETKDARAIVESSCILADREPSRERALSLVTYAMKTAEGAGDRYAIAGAVNMMGVVYLGHKEYTAAENMFARAIRLRTDIDDKPGLAGSMINLGTAYSHTKDLTSALEYLTRGLAIAEEIGYTEWCANAASNIASLCITQGRMDLALEYAAKAEKWFEALRSKSQIGPLLTMGRVYLLQGNVREALGCHRKMLGLAQRFGEPLPIAVAHMEIAFDLIETKAIDSALIYGRRAAESFEQLQDTARLIMSLGLIGRAYNHASEPDKALEILQRCMNLKESAHDTTDMHIENEITAIYQTRGRYDEAMALLQAALLRQQRRGSKINTSILLHRIGEIHAAQDRYEPALECFLRAAKLQEEIGHASALSGSYGSISFMLTALQRHKEALDYDRRVLALMEKIGEPTGIAMALSEIGITFERLELPDSASVYHRRALNLYEQLGHVPDKPEILTKLAEIHLHLRQNEKALEYYSRAVRLNEQQGNKLSNPTLLAHIAYLYVGFAKYDSAMAALDRMKSIAEQLHSLKDEEYATRKISELYAMKGDFVNAYQRHVEAAALKDSMVSKRNVKAINELMARYDAEKREQKIALLEKDRSLQELELKRRQDELLRRELEDRQRMQQLELLSKEKEIQSLTLASTNTELEKQRLETKEKQNEVTLLSKDKQLQASLLARETFRRNVSIIGAILLLVLAVILYNRYRYKKRTMEQLTSTLTQLRTTQAQLIHAEKMATLGEMTAGIAHEIKNPLNFVTNFSSISTELAMEVRERLKQDGTRVSEAGSAELLALVEALRNNTEKVTEHGRRADTIISQMMMHARRESGIRQSVEINRLVEDAVTLAESGQRGPAGEAAVVIAARYDPCAGEVEVLPQEIARVVLNLVSNAIYAARSGARRENQPGGGGEAAVPKVWVETERRDKCIEVRVRDSGPGVPEEIRDKIFQPFFTTKPTGEGTGLGLSMSYDIVVHGHGGSLTCVSPPRTHDLTADHGAEFVVTLPAEINR